MLPLGLKTFKFAIDKYGDTVLEALPGHYFKPKDPPNTSETQRTTSSNDSAAYQASEYARSSPSKTQPQPRRRRPVYRRRSFSDYEGQDSQQRYLEQRASRRQGTQLQDQDRRRSQYEPAYIDQSRDHRPLCNSSPPDSFIEAATPDLEALEAGEMSYGQQQARDIYGRQYNPADYAPSQGRDDPHAQQRGGYDREQAYNARANQQLSPYYAASSDDRRQRRPSSGYYGDQNLNPNSGYGHASDDDRGGDQRQRSRARESSRRRSRSESGSPDRDSEHQRGFMGDRLGKEKKDIAATVIGAIAGGFLAHEAGKGKKLATVGGAVLGGLSANAWEHQHIKKEERRRRNERQYNPDDSDSESGVRRRRSVSR